MLNGDLILDETADKATPNTVVLQPSGNLAEPTDTPFQTSLGQAIAQADAVVVDLLWIDTIDQSGLSILLSGMTQANKLGKSLSFLSMNQHTRSTLDSIWEKLQEVNASVQTDVFAPEFEQFLDNHQAQGVSKN
ncbi:STAS domain-containing protein [Myxacorys almedinensis]|uniref:STAS domain-containing protein n=1 Tax=Myxacorys almedinensis A TaxID=2690445 RepID=A0A8J7Z349_9CYAN|nr:STAS domain-containing protein [Myxacorys almedinensis]NDJ19117.1 hypothetical protein [Myxacorys almedinensis A]